MAKFPVDGRFSRSEGSAKAALALYAGIDLAANIFGRSVQSKSTCQQDREDQAEHGC